MYLKFHPRFFTSETGASMVEYAVALVLLIATFLAARDYLQTSADSRLDSSLNTATSSLPCEGNLSADLEWCK